ncbi:MAG: glycosyltransferase family 4 protein [Methanoregula sp.]|jgi:glycosyltransferase involved in cell wall biosynthesis|nr:glycosyltransferase family 4 protein [Methanoregula sp.]
MVLSSRDFAEKTWDTASIEYLKKLGVREISVYQKNIVDMMISAIIRRMYRVFNRFPPVDSVKYTPFGMRSWFKKIQREYRPDVLWMNYSVNDPLIDRREKTPFATIIDYHDLFSSNLKMQGAVKQWFTGKPYRMIDPAVLREDFFESARFSADKKELQVITGYDKIVAISRGEADVLRAFDRDADIIHIPVTLPPVDCNNTYRESAVFVTGPNVFNLQGLFYFTEKVLPAILRQCPDFTLRVTGACSDKVGPVKSVSFLGYVGDLKTCYCTARFAIGPVLGGTGQQIKITEAMAHGLPVVATRYSADSSPLVHGVSGFVAGNAEEFAGYCIRLWNDPELCRKMGERAGESIREKYSEGLLLTKLREVLDLPAE